MRNLNVQMSSRSSSELLGSQLFALLRMFEVAKELFWHMVLVVLTFEPEESIASLTCRSSSLSIAFMSFFLHLFSLVNAAGIRIEW